MSKEVKKDGYHPALHNRPAPKKQIKDALKPEQQKMLTNLKKNLSSTYQK